MEKIKASDKIFLSEYVVSQLYVDFNTIISRAFNTCFGQEHIGVFIRESEYPLKKVNNNLQAQFVLTQGWSSDFYSTGVNLASANHNANNYIPIGFCAWLDVHADQNSKNDDIVLYKHNAREETISKSKYFKGKEFLCLYNTMSEVNDSLFDSIELVPFVGEDKSNLNINGMARYSVIGNFCSPIKVNKNSIGEIEDVLEEPNIFLVNERADLLLQILHKFEKENPSADEKKMLDCIRGNVTELIRHDLNYEYKRLWEKTNLSERKYKKDIIVNYEISKKLSAEDYLEYANGKKEEIKNKIEGFKKSEMTNEEKSYFGFVK